MIGILERYEKSTLSRLHQLKCKL